MSHIDTAEKTMPVGIVRLGLPQMYCSSFWRTTGGVDAFVHAQHFLMLIIDFGIANQEVAPEATAHKLKQSVALLLFELVKRLLELIGFLRWQCPFGHFNV